MQKYKVLLTRSFVVSVKAKNKEEALRYTEYFVGGEKDLSNSKEKEKSQFEIEEIEMTVNEALQVESN